MDLKLIEDIEFEDVNNYDYPDYCDAFISSAYYKGTKMSDEEIEALPNDWVYNKLIETEPWAI